MTYRTEPYRAAHFHKLVPQDEQRKDLDHLNADAWSPESMEGNPHAFAAFRDDVLLGVAMAILIWPGRAQINLFLSMDVGRYDLLFLTRYIRQYLDKLQRDHRYRRCEATALEGFEPAHRWLRLFGFVAEGRMLSYDSSGRAHVLYSRIRP